MNKRLLLILLGVLVGCAPVTNAEIQEQELGYVNETEPSRVVTTVPSEHVDLIPNLESNPELSVDMACSCHLEVQETSGLVCVYMRCSDGCSQRTQDCATLFGGCGVR